MLIGVNNGVNINSRIKPIHLNMVAKLSQKDKITLKQNISTFFSSREKHLFPFAFQRIFDLLNISNFFKHKIAGSHSTGTGRHFQATNQP